jgi:hypothetical protein
MTRGDEVEVRRILARYKRLILLGTARLPLEEARRIVGPDCAYHLYSRGAAPIAARSRDRARRRNRPPRGQVIRSRRIGDVG